MMKELFGSDSQDTMTEKVTAGPNTEDAAPNDEDADAKMMQELFGSDSEDPMTEESTQSWRNTGCHA